MKKSDLWQLTDEAAEAVNVRVHQMDWSKTQQYGNWLAQTAYCVSHSTRILAAAAARFGVDRDDTHIQLIDHAKVERRHERIAINDLAVLGKKLSDFPELAGTKALYRDAYFLIEHVHPIAVFGYVAVLELLSLKGGPHVLRITDKAFGKKAMKYLTLHTEDDVEHIQTYQSLLAEAKGDERSAVEEAIRSTGANYCRMMEEIIASAEEKRKAA